jgi:predicted ATPase
MHDVIFPCELGIAQQLLGRVGDAVSMVELALRHVREANHLYNLCYALTVGASVFVYRREPETVRLRTGEAIGLSEQNGFPDWLVYGHLMHGWVLAELGRLEEGMAEMEEAITRAQLAGLPTQQSELDKLVSCYARVGRTTAALSMLDGALMQIERTGEKMLHAEMLRLKGEVLMMQDPAARNRS